MKNCEWCFEKFDKLLSRFCSFTCRNRFISSKNDYKSIGKKVSKTTSKLCQKFCSNCNICFFPKKKNGKFCSHRCSATFSNKNRKKETREKQSKTMKAKIASGEFTPTNHFVEKIIKNCLTCNKKMILCPSKINKKYCKKKCVPLYIRSEELKGTLESYRRSCKFTFGLSTYPDEFDFSLIKEYGFYSPTNKKNNLSGVSRDHMFSVYEGFINKIPPEILKHPANCKLMIHNQNVSKLSKSSITLEELLKRIKIWDQKYSNVSGL